MTKVVWSAATVIALFVGLLAGLNIGYERSPSRGSMDLRRFRGTKDGPLETGRTTDPTGRFDAVLLAESYGGAAGGGVNWYVASCKRNQPAVSATEAVFLATSARQVELSWRQAHLLEIHYLRAQILEFTNLWSTALIRTRWLSTEEPYWIEIRLVPSSSDFSILNAGGGFQ